MGTGFVISKDGYILTNNHVIADVDELEVRFNNGDTAKAEVVGADPKTDLALIRVKGVDGLKPLVLGDSEEIEPGDWVIAIGNPFGLSHTVTVGIVSAKGRQIGHGPYDDFIQTDAAINPGNSGGALVDRTGSLVGINTAIYSSSGDNDGIGFAVPVSIVQRVATEIIETGSASAPFLGIVGQTVTEVLAEEEGLGVSEGALVIEIEPETGAAEAGVQADDVIVSFNGEEVRSMDDLILAVRRTAVGDTITIELYRGDEPMEVDIVIGKKPDSL
jgi:serine protease Do